MGRTEFLTQRLEASPGWKAQTTHESEMALFNECTQSCAHIVLDTADIVRDGDFTTSLTRSAVSRYLGLFFHDFEHTFHVSAQALDPFGRVTILRR